MIDYIILLLIPFTAIVFYHLGRNISYQVGVKYGFGKGLKYGFEKGYKTAKNEVK